MSERNAYLDNAKGVLIVLVIMGHLVWPLPSSGRLHQSLYNLIYLFHMPMFALISGYLSRAEFSRQRIARDAAVLLAPLVVFELIQFGLTRAYALPFEPAKGLYGLWYLWSLFCWRLMLPIFARIRGAMIVAIMIALAVGYVSWIGLPLSASRTLTLFPYCLAGFMLKRRAATLHQIVPMPIALVALAFCAGLAWKLGHAHALLYGGFPYQELNLSLAYAPLIRLARIGFGLVAGLSVLAMIPQNRSILTRIGMNSLTVYLLHSPLLLIYRQHTAAYEFINTIPFLFIIPGACLVTIILSSETVVRWSRPLISPASRPVIDRLYSACCRLTRWAR